VTNAIGGVWSAQAVLLPEAPLQFTGRRMIDSGFCLSIYGPAGTNYVIDSSTNLADWLPIHTNTTQTGLFDFVDPAAPAGNCAFYRVRSVP
jgi:hypothetical protein